MDQASQLQIVSNFGVGYDNVDVNYAKEKGIAVTNLPRSTSRPTATLAMTLILSILRNVSFCDRKLRVDQIDSWVSTSHYGSSPQNKTLGIIGLGRIGKELAKQAAVFGMKIYYHNRNQLSPEIEAAYQATYVSFEALLRQSDIISIHTPLTTQTHQMIAMPHFEMMKPSAILINTSRGGVIDEEAMIQALQDNKIAAAGLDVFTDEPHIPSAFLEMDNVLLTPHIGTATFEDRQAMFMEAFQNIVDFFQGKNTEARVV